MENEKNGKNVKTIYVIIFVIAFTYASAIYSWVDGKLCAKADLSDYQAIIIKQEQIISELQNCKIRLTRIETILEKDHK